MVYTLHMFLQQRLLFIGFQGLKFQFQKLSHHPYSPVKVTCPSTNSFFLSSFLPSFLPLFLCMLVLVTCPTQIFLSCLISFSSIDVAEMVFNRCVTDNGKHIDHPNYEVRLNYELLEDVYADWCSIAGSDAASMHSFQVDSVQDVTDDQRIIGEREEEKATRQLENKSNHPLMLMVLISCFTCFVFVLFEGK